MAAGEGIPISVAGGGGSDLVTLSPVAQAGGILLAPIGLVGMLNSGGAVLRWVGGCVGGRGGEMCPCYSVLEAEAGRL